jgi:ferric iron reductase protein FhuF
MASDELTTAVAKLVAEFSEDDEKKTTTFSLKKATLKRLRHQSTRWSKSMSELIEIGVGPLLDQLEATTKPGEG